MKTVIVEKVVDLVAENTNVKSEQIMGRSREQGSGVVLARFLVYSILRDIYGLTYVTIAKSLNRRHSTVISAIQKLQRNPEQYNKFVEYRNYILNKSVNNAKEQINGIA